MQSRARKALQDFKLSFSGGPKEGPEDFLARLEDCRGSVDVSDLDLLLALPCVFTERASIWHRARKEELTNWKTFKKAFRAQFVGEHDREDLMDELRRRTQARGESMANFLCSFKYLIGFFRRPPTEREQVKIAYRKLLPENRIYIRERNVLF